MQSKAYVFVTELSIPAVVSNYLQAGVAPGIESWVSRSTCESNLSTVKPPNKGHFGDRPVVPCREVVLFSEVFY